jgi:hypothetical protein
MCTPCLERQALRYIYKQEEERREEEYREQEGEQGEQDVGKSTDLFTNLFMGRLTLSRAANPLLKLFTGP